MRTLGIVLLVAGILLMAIKGFNFTTKKKLADIGPVEINKKETTHMAWPLYVGAVCAVAGVVIIVAGNKKT